MRSCLSNKQVGQLLCMHYHQIKISNPPANFIISTIYCLLIHVVCWVVQYWNISLNNPVVIGPTVIPGVQSEKNHQQHLKTLLLVTKGLIQALGI